VGSATAYLISGCSPSTTTALPHEQSLCVEFDVGSATSWL
jgi:hypothetical protein